MAAGVAEMAKRGRRQTLIQQSRRESPERKAMWHQVEGAGKAHVIRKFLGMTEDDERVIFDRLQNALDKRVRDLS